MRLLNNLVSERIWEEVKEWIVKHTDAYEKIAVLGTGGNINKLIKLTQTKEEAPFVVALSSIYQLESLSYEERVLKFELNPDRADMQVLPTNLPESHGLVWCYTNLCSESWPSRWNDSKYVSRNKETPTTTIRGLFLGYLNLSSIRLRKTRGIAIWRPHR